MRQAHHDYSVPHQSLSASLTGDATVYSLSKDCPLFQSLFRLSWEILSGRIIVMYLNFPDMLA
jgi:hypothetical protein